MLIYLSAILRGLTAQAVGIEQRILPDLLYTPGQAPPEATVISHLFAMTPSKSWTNLCTDARQAKSVTEFRDVLAACAGTLSFDRFSAMVVAPRADLQLLNFRPGSSPASVVQTDRQLFINIDNTPEEYLEGFLDPVPGMRCPVQQHGKLYAFPLPWDRTTYEAAGAVELWESQAPYGYSSGIITSIHLAQGRHLMLGFDRGGEDVHSASQIEECTKSIALLMANIHQSTFDLMFMPRPDPGLTSREQEVVEWTAVGKTTGEIADILGISNSTAAKHVESVLRKLDSPNKQAAVNKAWKAALLT